jgi:ATP-dependent RNA helicase DDX10/DBP4
LFSATLGKDIMGLSRLMLNRPEKIFLNEKGQTNVKSYEMPSRLSHFYMMIPHYEKLDMLFSFLKSHRREKILVFFSTCKQVRYTYEAFTKLQMRKIN